MFAQESVMDIQEKKVFDAYFKEKYPELYKDVFDEDGDDRAIIGYSFAWSAWQAAKAQAVPEGFVLVPKNPTHKMMEASWASLDAGSADEWWDVYEEVMKAAQEPAND